MLIGVETIDATRKTRIQSAIQPRGRRCQPRYPPMPAANPIPSETSEYQAAIGSTVPALMKLAMNPESAPTQGPARMPPRTVPIESRKRGRLSSLSMERPAQSMAMQTGISTIPRVFRRNLNADSQAMVLVLALSIGPIRQD